MKKLKPLEKLGILITLLVFANQIFFLGQYVLKTTDFGKNLSAVISSVLVNEANKTREEFNINTLKINPLLEQAAQLKANHMAENQYFAHDSPTGETPWHWLNIVGYRFKQAGENLAINFSESEDIHNAWLNSPTHKANIVNGQFKEIGIATAEGVYQGKKTTYVAQFFGNPIETSTIVSKAETNKINPISVDDIKGGEVLGEDLEVSQDILVESQDQKFILFEKTPTPSKQPLEQSDLSNGLITNIFIFLFYIAIIYGIIGICAMVIKNKQQKETKITLEGFQYIVHSILLMVAISSLVSLNSFITILKF